MPFYHACFSISFTGGGIPLVERNIIRFQQYKNRILEIVLFNPCHKYKLSYKILIQALIEERKMKIFLIGIACIGKSTIGIELAKDIGYKFFDLDIEIEKYFEKPISHLKSQFLTEYSFREKASIALKKIIEENENENYIVALPPSGLHDWYYKKIKKTDSIVIALNDKPENILKRITFYDDDSNLIQKQLTDKEKKLYLKEIKEDRKYYRRFYKKANYQIDIRDLDVPGSVQKLKELLSNIK